MASKEADKNGGCNTETEEETIALQKKRSRRVSFAETTAVHLFIRDDEDHETPPNAGSEAGDSGIRELNRSESEEIMELLQSSDESDDGDDDGVGGEDEELAVKRSFLRPMESPSPGSTFGSATSNDEDNFFGPVSTDFIRARGLSDSAASDENHDITMDSTAFSMHFRSLARSDSGGEIKTPTGIHLAFDERTPGQNSTTTSIGDLMVVTGASKASLGSPLPSDKVNDSGHSDDMSLVTENLHRYDYGELPPELDVLLAEGGRHVDTVSLTSNVVCSNSISSLKKDTISASDQNRHKLLDLRDDKGADACHVADMQKTSADARSAAGITIDKGNDSIAAATLGDTTHNGSYCVDNDSVSITLADDGINAPVLMTDVISFGKNEESRKDADRAGGKFESPLSSTQSNLDSEQITRPSLEGLVSSLLAKRRQIFKVSDNLCNDQLNSIPLLKELCNNESIEHALSTSYFTKGVSRLKRLDAFPFASTSKVERTSRLTSSRRLTRSMSKNYLLGYRSKDILINHVDAPVACLEAHFSNVAENEGEFKSLSKMHKNVRPTKDRKYASCNTEVIDVELQSPFTALPSHCKSTNPISAMVSPSFTALQKKGFEHRVLKDNDTKGTLLSMGNESSLAEITVNDMRYISVTGMHDDSVLSPENEVERMVSASSQCKETLSMILNPEGQSHLRLDQDAAANEAKDLASRTEDSSSLLFERKAETNTSSSDNVHSKDVAQESQMQNGESMVRNPVTSMCFQTSLMDKAFESCALGSLSDDGQTRRTSTKSAKAFAVQHLKSVAGHPASLDRQNELPIQAVERSTVELPCIPLPEELCDSANVATPGSNWLPTNYDNTDELLETPYDVCDSNRSSGLKRKYGGLFDKAEDNNNEIASLKHSPKLHKVQNHCVEGSQVYDKTGGDTKLRQWPNVFTSFCGETQQLLSPLIDKLDLAQIEILDDILLHQERMKSYELLHCDVGFQKPFDFACFLQNKRMVETKLLLYRSVYEKAKLLLLQRKRNKLLDQVQLLNSSVQESKKLMSSCQQSCAHNQKDVQVDGFQSESYLTDIQDKSLGSDDITSLREELEVSDNKIKNLTESFHTYFKVMKSPTCTVTTEFVKVYLKKRVSCRSLQSELQLCEVESLKNVNGQQNCLFDHLGFLSQRFIVNFNSTSGMSISKMLNNLKISKMFLTMDACTAFSFVLNDEDMVAYAGLRTIAQETQKTNLLLHNLLDVVEEVELAMIELKNLTQSRFCQRSAGRLDVQFCFSDFKSGATVTLSIDITCLNRGVYPAQVLPYEVLGRAAGNDDAFQSLLSNIRTSVRGLRCGYMRIISLCRCVSKLIQASNHVR